jgi:hypothetical protein
MKNVQIDQVGYNGTYFTGIPRDTAIKELSESKHALAVAPEKREEWANETIDRIAESVKQQHEADAQALADLAKKSK